MPHGRHIYTKASDMENSKMCAYPKSHHSLTLCKYIDFISSCSHQKYIHYKITQQLTDKL